MRVLLAIVTVFTFLRIFSGTALAQGTGSITISGPSSGPGGTVISATTSGYPNGGVVFGVEIAFSKVPITTPPNGTQVSGCDPMNPNCTVQIATPDEPGTYYVVAWQGEGNVANSATTWTTVPYTATLKPTCGPLGTIATVTGTGFNINPPPTGISLIFNGTLPPFFLGITPDSSGNFTQTFLVPATGVVGVNNLIVSNYPGNGDEVVLPFTAPSCYPVGTVTQITGVVTDNGTPLAVGDTVNLGDKIVTGPNAQVLFTLIDNTTFTLSENGNLTIDEYVYSPNATPSVGKAKYGFLEGAFQYISGLIGKQQDEDVNIDTPVGSIGIRGTQFLVWPGPTPTPYTQELDLISGTVDITPIGSTTTTAFTGPITIVFNTTGETTSPLTQDQYNANVNTVFPPPSMDTTPPKVTVTFPTPPAAQNGWFNATAGQEPVSGSVSAMDPSNVTAITCGNNLGGFVEGALTGGGTAAASQTLSVSYNGTNNISCTATDGAGNVGAAMGSANTATVKIDTVPPTITGAAAPPANAFGWNNTPVTVTFTCSDAISGIASCTAPVVLSTQGTNLSANGTAIDNAGNSNQTTVGGIKLETAPPAVTYTGNAGTYNVNQTVNITCGVTPSLSPIITNTCANISGPAYSFGLGAHPYSASASDQAGNTGNGNTSFTVVLNFTGLIGLVNQFETKAGVAAQIVADIQGAQASFAKGIINAGDNQLNAAINLISAQSGKSLTTAQAGLLTQYLHALMM